MLIVHIWFENMFIQRYDCEVDAGDDDVNAMRIDSLQS